MDCQDSLIGLPTFTAVLGQLPTSSTAQLTPLLSATPFHRPARYVDRNMLQLIDERPEGIPESEVLNYIEQTLSGLQW